MAGLGDWLAQNPVQGTPQFTPPMDGGDIDRHLAFNANWGADPITRGYNTGARGLANASKTYLAGALEQMGNQQGAQGIYQDVARDNAAHEGLGPYVGSIHDINGLGSALNYAGGAVGGMIPAVAPALVGGGLARAVGAGPVGSFVGATAPLFPSMAGASLERMNADPTTAGLPINEKMSTATGEGIGASAIFGAVPWAMQGRALGEAGLAAKASLNPVRGMAQDVALGGVGMGAANMGVGQLGRTVQRGYNPDFQKGEDAGLLGDEFASGLVGGGAIAAPHAVLGHTFGVANDGTRGAREVIGAGIKYVGKAAWEKMPDAVQATVDAVVGTGKFTKNQYDAVKQFAGSFKGELKTAYDEAQQQYEMTRSEQESNAAATGDPTTLGDKSAALGAKHGEVLKGAAKAFGSAFTDAVYEGTDHGKTFVDGLKELGTRIAGVTKRAITENKPVGEDQVDTILRPLESLVKEIPAEGPLASPAINALRPYVEKWKAGEKLGTQDVQNIALAAKSMHSLLQKKKYQDFFSAKEEEANTPNEGPTSGSSQDRGSAIVKKVLTQDAHMSASLADQIANQMQIRRMLMPGVTKHINDLRGKIKDIVLNHPDVASRPPEEQQAIYQRVRDAVESVKPQLQAERMETAKQADVPVAADPEAMHGAIKEAARNLFDDPEGGEGDVGMFHQATDGIANTIMNIASGKNGSGRAAAMLSEGLAKKGEKGDAFLDRVIAAAQAAYGHDSAAVERLDRLNVSHSKQNSTYLRFQGALKEQGNREQNVGTMRQMLSEFRQAKADDVQPQEAAQKYQELKTRAMERAQAGDEKAYEESTKMFAKANALKKMMDEGKTPMQGFIDSWVPKFKNKKGFHDAMEAAITYQRETSDNVMSSSHKSGTDNAASKTALKDDLQDQGVQQRAGEGRSVDEEKPVDASAMSEHGELLDALEANSGSRGEPDDKRSVQYHGESTLRGIHDEDAVTAPVTNMYSGDYKGGMFSSMLDQMRATWGGPRVADLEKRGVTKMQEWADDMAERTGRSRSSLLNEAMDKLLAHDKQRLEKLKQVAPGTLTKEGTDNTNAVEQSIDWIERRQQQAEALADDPNRGSIFFSDKGTQRHYGYAKLEGVSGANIEINADTLKRYSTPVYDGERVDNAFYAQRQAAREGTSESNVERSLLDVQTKDGTVPLDFARLMRDTLSRHQQGDTIGVDDLQGGKQTAAQSTAQQKLQERLDFLNSPAGAREFATAKEWNDAKAALQEQMKDAASKTVSGGKQTAAQQKLQERLDFLNSPAGAREFATVKEWKEAKAALQDLREQIKEAGKTVSGDQTERTIYTDKELERAALNLLGHLRVAEGVDGFKMEPDLVVWRDGKLTRTLGELTDAREFDAKGNPVRDSKIISTKAIDSTLIKHNRVASENVDDRDARDRPAYANASPKTRAALDAQAAKKAAEDADRGMVRGIYPGTSLDTRALLKEVMKHHGLDTYDLERLPKGLAAQLLVEGLTAMYEAKGANPLFVDGGRKAGELKTFPDKSTERLFPDASDPRNAWENAVVYKRSYGDKEFPVTLKELLNHERGLNLPTHDMDTARLHEARAKLKEIEERPAKDAAKGKDQTDYGTWNNTGKLVESLEVKRDALVKSLDGLRSEESKATQALDGLKGKERGAAQEALNAKTAERKAAQTKIDAINDTLVTAKEHTRQQEKEYAERDETNASGFFDESRSKELKYSRYEMLHMQLKSMLKEHQDSAGETPLFDKSEALRSADKAEADASTQPSWTDIANRVYHTKPSEDISTEGPITAGGAMHRGEPLTPKQTLPDAPVPRMAEPVSKADSALPPAVVSGEKAVQSKRGPEGLTASDPTLVKQARELQAASHTAERARRDDVQARWNERRDERFEKVQKRAANAARLAEARADQAVQEKLAKVAETMPNKNPVDLSNLVGTVQHTSETVKTGKGEATVKKSVEGVDGDPFSESSRRGQGTATEKIESQRDKLLKEAQKLAGDLVGDLNLTKDSIGGKDAAGLWKGGAQKLIEVSVFHPNQKGVLHHEVWHAIEDYLGTLGPQGKRVLDAIYKHADTPLMRARLESLYKGDAGALKQIKEGETRERAAYAFQAHMKGDTLPLHPDSKGVFGKIKDFLMKAAHLLGFDTKGEKMNQFFDFVKRGDFARDKDNVDAVERGMGETKLQKTLSSVDKGFVDPLKAAITALVGHTSQRMTDTGVKEYQKIREMYEGPQGKMGYNGRLNMMTNSFGNRLARIFGEDGKTVNQRNYNTWHDQFSKYLKDSGLDANEIKRVKAQKAYDIRAIDSHYKEWEHDVVQFGGLDGKEARGVARDVLNRGYFDHEKLTDLFGDHPEIAKKWLDKDQYSTAARMVSYGVKMAERRRAFDLKDDTGKWIKDGKRDDLLKAGDATASPEAQQMAKDFVASYEGTLGKGLMSPAMEKVMGVLLTANNVRMLPLAIFSQSIEAAQLGFRANDVTKSFSAFSRGIRNMPRAFKEDYGRDYWDNLAEDCGTVASAQVGGMLNQFYNGIQIRGLTGRVNDAFFKYNFMDGWNSSMHVAATKMGVEFLREHAAGANAKHSERFLKELGVTKNDIKFDKEGHIILTDKTSMALTQFVNEAMAHPDAGSNPLWMNDPRFALLAQMKRFNFAHARYVLERGVREWKHGNYTVLAPVGAAMAFTAAGDWLKHGVDITSSGQSYADTLNLTDYTMFRLERAGMFGRWAFPLDAERSISQGGTGLEALLGPTAELFSRVATGAHKNNLLDAMLGNLPGLPQASMPD